MTFAEFFDTVGRNAAAGIWLALLLGFLGTEALTVQLVSVWFALGALTAMIAALLGAGIWVQIWLFLLVSGALVALLRPIARKFLLPRVTATNVDSVVGATGLVSEAVDNVCATGRVKLGAMDWTARSTTGEEIPVGTLVRVDRIEGVKVFVAPVQVPEKV